MDIVSISHAIRHGDGVEGQWKGGLNAERIAACVHQPAIGIHRELENHRATGMRSTRRLPVTENST